MLAVHAVFPIDPESRDEALDMIESLAEQSRQEDGVIDHRVPTDVDDPNVFRLFERDEDEAAFKAHAETDHSRRSSEHSRTSSPANLK